MAYASKYLCEFTGINGLDYYLSIQEKDYVGVEKRLLASASPIIHKWATDDVFAPIKGSSLVLNYINTGKFPLSIFYSNDDTKYKGTLTSSTGEILFDGFLVQDDCSELMVDFEHVCSLSFNDNLGLLKDVNFSDAVDVSNDKLSIISILNGCLLKTNLDLSINIYCDLKSLNTANQLVYFEDVLIGLNTFKTNSDNSFESCYSVLEKILKRFRLTLLQAYNSWFIVSWYDAVNNQFTWLGRKYIDGVFDSDITFNNTIPIGLGEDVTFETGLLQRIDRPFKYAKETFNFTNVGELVNANLKTLGNEIASGAFGSGTYTDYEFTDWQRGFFWSSGGSGTVNNTITSFFIRVIKDSLGLETERYVVIKGTTNDAPSAIQGQYIEVSKGDVIKLSFDFKTQFAQSLPATFVFDVKLIKSNPPTPLSANGRMLSYNNVEALSNDNGQWKTTRNFAYQATYQDTDQWQTVEAISDQIPFDGMVIVSLAQCDSGNETYYRNISFTIEQFVNGQSKIIGQTHNCLQDEDIKKNSEETIFIDDSPRNSIKGTLFFDSLTNLINDRTRQWTDGTNTATFTGVTIQFIEPNQILIINSPTFAFNIGGSIIINGGAANNGVYTITNVQQPNFTDVLLTVAELVINSTDTYNFTLINKGLKRLGELTTTSDLFQHYLSRTMLDGSTYGIFYDPQICHLSLLNIIYYTYFTTPQLLMTWGMLEIDYRNNKSTGTLLELYKLNEDKQGIEKTYNFDYIYKTS